MSREHNDGIEAMLYASEAWRSTRDELLSRPTFCVQGIVDKWPPGVCEIMEKELRRHLLEGMGQILCDGDYHVVRVARQEELLPQRDCRETAKVTYRAEISEVQHRHYMIQDAWYEFNSRKKSTGRNHRKKDRAKARRQRAERKKLAARLKTHE